MNKQFILLTLGKLDWGKACRIVVGVWVLMQIVVAGLYWDVQQVDDYAWYLSLAQECFEAGRFYPYEGQVYSYYLFAPGFVNFLILQLACLGTMKLNVVFCLLFNIGILANIFFITKHFFEMRVAQIAAILYCLLYNNLFVIVPAGTETPFLFLCLSAVSCVLGESRMRKVFAAGVLLMIANWIRPLAVVYIVFILCYFLACRKKWTSYVCFFVAVVTTAVAIGLVTKASCGRFAFQSSTAGANLMMLCHAESNGGIDYSVFSEGKAGYIENEERVTFWERDSIWRARSVEYIKNYPLDYLRGVPKRLLMLYADDSWAGQVLESNSELFYQKWVKGEFSTTEFVGKLMVRMAKSMVYYVIGFIFLLTLVKKRREIGSRKGLVLVVMVVATGVTVLFPVGGRYHYPFYFPMIVWAAYGLDQWLRGALGMGVSEAKTVQKGLLLMIGALICCGCTRHGQLMGGYDKPSKPTAEEVALFHEALGDSVAAMWMPKKVSRQVVAGFNYRFHCVGKDGRKKVITVHQPLPRAIEN